MLTSSIFEVMACRRTELTQDGQHSQDIPWTIRVVGMAGDTDKTVFCDRTSGLGRLTPSGKPPMSSFVMNMHRIAQGKQHIHI